jgi:hypothetical protein
MRHKDNFCFNDRMLWYQPHGVDMTVSLIDAYGRCRDDAKSHERCMSIIRNTLDHARQMIGQ